MRSVSEQMVESNDRQDRSFMGKLFVESREFTYFPPKFGINRLSESCWRSDIFYLQRIELCPSTDLLSVSLTI